MCGISGYFDFSSCSSSNSNTLLNINNSIKHRGPDDEGFVTFTPEGFQNSFGNDTPKDVIDSLNLQTSINESPNSIGGLGHRRLSIIDLSPSSHQPYSSTNQKKWMVFNGEIYNYIELRNELKELGHHFNSNGDTEVLLKSYEQWGMDCLSKLDGMFAFVIYDLDQNKIVGARDPLGVKPMYLYVQNQKFAFCSEQQALNTIPDFNKDLHKQYLFDYLVFGDHERRRESIFQNIQELKGGEYFEYDIVSSTLSFNTYFELERKQVDSNPDFLKNLIIESVSKRLRSDVEVGTCLSGGLDSSIIAGVMRHCNPKGKNIHSFTSHYPGFEFDEKQYADEVIEFNKLNGHFVSPHIFEFEDDFSEFISSLDLPVWSSSTYAQWRVLKLAKQKGIKVVLDGQGADELFAGYNPHYMSYWRDLLKAFKIGHLLKEFKHTYGTKGSTSYLIKEWMKHYGVRKLPKSLAIYMHQKAFDDLKYLNLDFYTQELNEAYDHYRSRLDTTDFQGFLKSELINGRLKTYLRCEDRCSMWHGIESRTPFADDRELIQHAWNIPANEKIVNGEKKKILKDSMKEFLPNKVYSRKDKIGFVTPNNKWMSQIAPKLKNNFDDSLSPFMDIKRLNKDYNQFFNPKTDTENGRVFKYLAFSQWYKNYRSSQ